MQMLMANANGAETINRNKSIVYNIHALLLYAHSRLGLLYDCNCCRGVVLINTGCVARSKRLRVGGVLGDSLGALGDGVLGELSGEDEAHEV